MRDQLIQYVSLLFAGAENCEDTKQEILQNTLDRYDDLIAEGKPEEAAYRLAIISIGDINEILGQKDAVLPAVTVAEAQTETDTAFKKLLRAIAVGLYILCPLPLIVLSELGMDTFGLCGLLCFVAVATVLDVIVDHPIYGQLTGPLQLASRYDVSQFIARCARAEVISQMNA